MSLLSEVVGAPVKSKGGYDASSNIIPPDGNPGDIYQITVAGVISGFSENECRGTESIQTKPARADYQILCSW